MLKRFAKSFEMQSLPVTLTPTPLSASQSSFAACPPRKKTSSFSICLTGNLRRSECAAWKLMGKCKRDITVADLGQRLPDRGELFLVVGE